MRALKALCNFIQNHEQVEGVVTALCESRDSSEEFDPIKEIDAFVEGQGYLPLGSKWCALSNHEAVSHLQSMLRTSLAYGVGMLNEEEALTIAQELSELFGTEPARWFTNGSRGGWNPITKSTFENATVVINKSNVALILFEDED